MGAGTGYGRQKVFHRTVTLGSQSGDSKKIFGAKTDYAAWKMTFSECFREP